MAQASNVKCNRKSSNYSSEKKSFLGSSSLGHSGDRNVIVEQNGDLYNKEDMAKDISPFS